MLISKRFNASALSEHGGSLRIEKDKKLFSNIKKQAKQTTFNCKLLFFFTKFATK